VLGSIRASPSTIKPRLLFFYTPREGASRRSAGDLSKVLRRLRNRERFVIDRIDTTRSANTLIRET
jgi:hypothetical protein